MSLYGVVFVPERLGNMADAVATLLQTILICILANRWPMQGFVFIN